MIQKGTDPFCTILAASRYWGAVFFYRKDAGCTWHSRRRKLAKTFIFFSRKSFAESCRKRKFAGVKLQGGA